MLCPVVLMPCCDALSSGQAVKNSCCSVKLIEEATVDRQWEIFEALSVQFSSVQSLSRVWLFATPWIAAPQASLSITISWSSLRLTSIESVMPSSHLILCRPLFLLPPIPPSIRVDWLNLFAVQGTLKSLLQHHSSKASILRRSFRRLLFCSRIQPVCLWISLVLFLLILRCI